MSSNGFTQSITYIDSKIKNEHRVNFPSSYIMTSNRRSQMTDNLEANVSCCCQGANSKMNPSSFINLQKHLKLYPTGYKVESPELS